MSALRILICLTIAGFPTELWAQSPSLTDWYSRGIIRQQTVDLMIARQQRRDYDPYLAKIGRSRIVDKPGPARGPASASSQDTVFHTVEPAFVPRQLAARLGKTPQERQYLEELLTKCLNFYTDTARQKGVPLHDVARALNYYIATNYLVHAQGTGPTQGQMEATRNMIRANLARDENFRRMSDREKQESYEALIVIAGFVDVGYGSAKRSGNEKLAAQFREMARHNLETLLGVPVQRIRFTNEGLALN